jgi:hypothetical protein
MTRKVIHKRSIDPNSIESTRRDMEEGPQTREYTSPHTWVYTRTFKDGGRREKYLD